MDARKIIDIAKQVIPPMVGMCSSIVSSKLLGTYLPESDKIVTQAVTKIGSIGIGAVVSAEVGKAMEREVNDLAEFIEQFLPEEEEKPRMVCQATTMSDSDISVSVVNVNA